MSEHVVFELPKKNIESYMNKYLNCFTPTVFDVDENKIQILLDLYMHPGNESAMLTDLHESALALIRISEASILFYPNSIYVFDDEFSFETITIKYNMIMPDCLDIKRYLITE